MAKDALIKLRCSQDLKDRLTALASKRDKDLSEYIRDQLYSVIESEEFAAVGEAAAEYVRRKGDAALSSKAKSRK